MARIVFGLGVSHSPMLSTPLDQWPLYVDKDRHLPQALGSDLLATDGRYYTYDELLARADPALQRELTPEKYRARYEACQAAIARSGEVLSRAAPDVLVVIGDDQEEMFHEDNMPAMAVYWGDRFENIPPPLERLSPTMRVSAWGYYDERPTVYPGEARLGQHLIESLVADGFDVAHARHQREGVGMAHAYTFFHRRILNGQVIPLVPVFINTYFPPNQPTAGRCYALGKALARAIEAWDSDQRVAIAASGGLSHFVVDEELDQTILTAIQNHDADTIGKLPENRLQSGNSEAKNWIALGAATEHLQMELIDYIPCYRSPAGTGCAMGFAQWT